MNKLVVISHSDNYDVGGLVRYFIKMFNREDIRSIFYDNGFEILTSSHIRNISSLDKSENHKCDHTIEFSKNIENSERDKYIFLGIHPYGINTVLEISPDFKKMIWVNDPHYFAYFADRGDETVQDFAKKFNPRILEKIDYLITPSPIYFKNLDIDEYDNKMIFLFYFLDEEFYTKTGNTEYSKRLNKILLSGCVGGGYLSRIEFDKLRSDDSFKELIDKVDHPGYNNNDHMTELKYYDELTKYKAAFVGHYKFPINFLLAKHIEILMCGCLGFFEPNPLLEKELGLIAFKHYIPCYNEDNQLIKDSDFYFRWINSKEGEEIAEEGKKYVRSRFGKNYISEFAQSLSKLY
jgi:hypothetical protein